MKELSIKEKAKRYDEAIKVAKEWHIDAQIDFKKSLETLFPELKESEDERVRKAIIEFFELQDDNTTYSLIPKKDILAWLEKQGEPKDEEIVGEDRHYIETIEYAIKNTFKDEENPHRQSALGWLKKKCEQNHADKVEPKFKIGDIVKHKDNPHLTYILKKFTDDGDYEFHAIGKDGNEGCTRFTVVKYQDDWELVEQKPKKCMYSNDNYTYEERKVLCDGCKEECELQQKPEWSEEDENMLEKVINSLSAYADKLQYEGFCHNKDVIQEYIVWLKSLKDRVQPQPKQAWSEEEIEKAAQEWDSKANFNPFYMTMDGDKPTGVKQDITTHKESFKAGINWILKSLRLQSHWKPSDEQLYWIKWVAHRLPDTEKANEAEAVLEELLEQLKKLKG